MLKFPANTFRPFAGMRASEILVVLACRALACLLVLGVVLFVIRAATPFVMADAWFYVYTLIHPWQEGHLAVADFFVKRGLSDHMQPLYRLILLMHTAWFHMDFTVEALLGVGFALACVYLWHRLARNEMARAPGTRLPAELTGLGLLAVVFSLNVRGVYDWPLVTLAFMGIFVVSALLAALPVLVERRRFVAIGALTLLVSLVDDTYGMLAVACALVLLAGMRLRGELGMGSWWRASAVLVAVVVGYVAICHALFPYRGSASPQQEFGPLLTLLKGHWRESWKLIVIPAGTTIAAPQQLVHALKVSLWAVPPILVVLAIPVCAAHVWFWLSYLRRKPNALTFLAAGLMLFLYFTLAAILVSRLPRFGFDYLYEGRYMQVYELQLVAVLMMSAQVLSERPVARLHKWVLAVSVSALVALSFACAVATHHEVRFIHAYQVKIAEQMEQLAADPRVRPQQCMASFITPCNWGQASRVAVLEALERGPYNVFSPTFRKWHRRQVPKVWVGPVPSP